MDDILKGLLKGLGEAGLLTAVQAINKLVSALAKKIDGLTDDNISVSAQDHPITLSISTGNDGNGTAA